MTDSPITNHLVFPAPLRYVLQVPPAARAPDSKRGNTEHRAQENRVIERVHEYILSRISMTPTQTMNASTTRR